VSGAASAKCEVRSEMWLRIARQNHSGSREIFLMFQPCTLEIYTAMTKTKVTPLSFTATIFKQQILHHLYSYARTTVDSTINLNEPAKSHF
jgi:hypothetical protein